LAQVSSCTCTRSFAVYSSQHAMQSTTQDDCSTLLATEARAPSTSSCLAARGIVSFVAALAAVGVMSNLALSNHGNHLDKMLSSAVMQAVETKVYGYKDVGKGSCLLPDGKRTRTTYTRSNETRAQSLCQKSPQCLGYVKRPDAPGAYLYLGTLGPVKGGGKPPRLAPEQPCMAKVLRYKSVGKGSCLLSDGKRARTTYTRSNETRAQSLCEKSPQCLGYVKRPDAPGAYLYLGTLGPAKGGGKPPRLAPEQPCMAKVDQ